MVYKVSIDFLNYLISAFPNFSGMLVPADGIDP